MSTGGDVVQRLDSQNLRDFLRIKEEDHRDSNLNPSAAVNGGVERSNRSGVTLHTFLSDKRRPPVEEPAPLQRAQSNRTLLDIIREDHVARRDGKRSWRQLKEKILLRRRGGGGTSWTSSVLVPVSDVPVSTNNRMMATMMMNPRPMERLRSDVDSSGEATRGDVSVDSTTTPSIVHTNASSATSSLPRRSLQRELNDIRVEEEEEQSGTNVEESAVTTTMAEGESEAEQPMRMSLMALLAETDRQMGMECSVYMMEEYEEEEEDATPAPALDGVYNNCCVCLVRHKGAAFIPCGHTFCRLCSRELLAQRGNCPLCNNFILEILDIF